MWGRMVEYTTIRIKKKHTYCTNVIPNASDNTVAYLINTLPQAAATVNHQLAKAKLELSARKWDENNWWEDKKGPLIRLFALLLENIFLANSTIKFQILHGSYSVQWK